MASKKSGKQSPGGPRGPRGKFLDEARKRLWIEFYLTAVRIYVSHWLGRFGQRGLQDVDDVVQSAARRALQARAPSDRKLFEKWILKRADHALRAWMRRTGVTLGAVSGHPAAERIDPQRTAEEAMEHQEAIEAMNKALADLRPSDQQILVARYKEERTVEEIAAELRKSPKAVRSHLDRAMRNFRAAAMRRADHP
jgi:RNA polymerase sigma factor (sigma-70 family)